ncbi:nucleotidyltransferase family protein [Vibrio sp. Of7-15]|uniref:nucleotidyltransferase family protein n=1 Tax=Vibrio sp. Of7-15 TaxID=2724879 RepID=UPI001EF2D388|nr:nucleotidyltransferase family protein [Vibrio sp. Of7-15]MCG7499394.1 nucleotidyltransferase family protein [Vibrio sp. Of7-15]
MAQLLEVMRNPEKITHLTTHQLSDLICEARFHNMLSQLSCILNQHELKSILPHKFLTHLHSSDLQFQNQVLQLKLEHQQLSDLLTPITHPFVYLKGAAYHLAGFEEFSGRFIGDIDILISEESLPRTEKVLMGSGWITTKINSYDNKFYREYSQEIPPLKHLERGTELDVHFNILPKTLKQSRPGEIWLNHSIPLSDSNPNCRILKPEAMVLHSAIHLFYESEYHKGTRDLYDLYLLFTRFQKDPSFWHNLIQTTDELDNGDAIFIALRYCASIFHLSVPAHVISHYQQFSANSAYQMMLDLAFTRIFCCSFPPDKQLGHVQTETFLYLRGHLKRMPLKLLIPHLTRKFFMQFKKEKPIDPEEIRL